MLFEADEWTGQIGAKENTSKRKANVWLRHLSFDVVWVKAILFILNTTYTFLCLSLYIYENATQFSVIQYNAINFYKIDACNVTLGDTLLKTIVSNVLSSMEMEFQNQTS